MELKQGFRLGAFEVRPLTGEVAGAGGTTHLEPKVMEVLAALAQRPGEVVEREELLQRIWGHRAAVADEPLTRCIAELRRVLGDSRQTPTFIQTIPKRGYRLLCAVTPLAGSPPPALAAAAPVSQASAPLPAAIARRRTHPALLGSGFAALLAVTAIAVWAMSRDSAESESVAPIDRNTIAVLPFIDVGGSPDDAYFGEGLADEILNRLSAVEGLRVVARTSSFAVRASTDDVRSIAQRLTVAHVLEGTVRRDGERVRIDVQLVDAARGYRVWGERYDGVLGDIFALQDEIANTIVAKLRDTVPTDLPTDPIATSAPTRISTPTSCCCTAGSICIGATRTRCGAAFSCSSKPSSSTRATAKPTWSSRRPTPCCPRTPPRFRTRCSTWRSRRSPRASSKTPRSTTRCRSCSRSSPPRAGIGSRRRSRSGARSSTRATTRTCSCGTRSSCRPSAARPRAPSTRGAREELDLLSPVVNHRLSVASMWIDADDEAARYARSPRSSAWAGRPTPTSSSSSGSATTPRFGRS